MVVVTLLLGVLRFQPQLFFFFFGDTLYGHVHNRMSSHQCIPFLSCLIIGILNADETARCEILKSEARANNAPRGLLTLNVPFVELR